MTPSTPVHALTLQQSERIHAVMSPDDRVAFGFELRAEQLQAGGIVVNDEEGHGVPASATAVSWSDSSRVLIGFSR